MDKFVDQASNVVWVRYNKRVALAERLCEFRNASIDSWSTSREVHIRKLDANAFQDKIPKTSEILRESALDRAMETETRFSNLLGFAEVFTIGPLNETVQHIKKMHILRQVISQAAFYPQAKYLQLPYYDNWPTIDKKLQPHFSEIQEVFAAQIRDLRFKLRRHVVYTSSKQPIPTTDLSCCTSL